MWNSVIPVRAGIIVCMLAVYSIFFACLMAVVCNPARKKYYIVVKTVCSLAFLAVLFCAGFFGGRIHQFWLMLPAFFCCLAGDIFMAYYNRYRKRLHFVMGLGIFLMGHVCFVRWLCVRQPISLYDFLFPVAAVMLTLGLTAYKHIHTGRLRPFIAAYAFFVALFFSKGIHLLVAEPGAANFLVAVGGTLFLCSDISILFLYFYKQKSVRIHVFNLATYYYGMFFLAANLWF